MPSIHSVLSTDNPLFTDYLFYASILGLKVLFMAPLTARQRYSKKVFPAKEDTQISPNAVVKYDDPDIERVRRAHLNDLENIPIFLTVSLGYIMTQPDHKLALNLFRVYTAARFIHTFVYAVYVMPQPSRGLAWGAGYITTVYMAVKTALYFGKM